MKLKISIGGRIFQNVSANEAAVDVVGLVLDGEGFDHVLDAVVDQVTAELVRRKHMTPNFKLFRAKFHFITKVLLYFFKFRQAVSG